MFVFFCDDSSELAGFQENLIATLVTKWLQLILRNIGNLLRLLIFFLHLILYFDCVCLFKDVYFALDFVC